MGKTILNIKAKLSEKGIVNTNISFLGNPEFDKILSIMQKESDQAVVIVGHSFLEELLDRLMKKRLFGEKAIPRITFDKKVSFCYSIGVLTDYDKRDLERINKIRNNFAHRFNEIDFNSEIIASICKKFEFFNTINKGMIESTTFSNRQKCESEIAYLFMSLQIKLALIPPIEKCSIPNNFNDPA